MLALCALLVLVCYCFGLKSCLGIVYDGLLMAGSLPMEECIDSAHNPQDSYLRYAEAHQAFTTSSTRIMCFPAHRYMATNNSCPATRTLLVAHKHTAGIHDRGLLGQPCRMDYRESHAHAVHTHLSNACSCFGQDLPFGRQLPRRYPLARP